MPEVPFIVALPLFSSLIHVVDKDHKMIFKVLIHSGACAPHVNPPYDI